MPAKWGRGARSCSSARVTATTDMAGSPWFLRASLHRAGAKESVADRLPAGEAQLLRLLLHRQPILGGVVAGHGEEADVLELLRIVLGNGPDGKGQHRVVRAFAGRHHADAVGELGGAVVGIEVSGLEDFLLALEALQC